MSDPHDPRDPSNNPYDPFLDPFDPSRHADGPFDSWDPWDNPDDLFPNQLDGRDGFLDVWPVGPCDTGLGSVSEPVPLSNPMQGIPNPLDGTGDGFEPGFRYGNGLDDSGPESEPSLVGLPGDPVIDEPGESTPETIFEDGEPAGEFSPFRDQDMLDELEAAIEGLGEPIWGWRIKPEARADYGPVPYEPSEKDQAENDRRSGFESPAPRIDMVNETPRFERSFRPISWKPRRQAGIRLSHTGQRGNEEFGKKESSKKLEMEEGSECPRTGESVSPAECEACGDWDGEYCVFEPGPDDRAEYDME